MDMDLWNSDIRHTCISISSNLYPYDYTSPIRLRPSPIFGAACRLMSVSKQHVTHIARTIF